MRFNKGYDDLSHRPRAGVERFSSYLFHPVKLSVSFTGATDWPHPATQKDKERGRGRGKESPVDIGLHLTDGWMV